MIRRLRPSTLVLLAHRVWLARQAIEIAASDPTLPRNVAPLDLHREHWRAKKQLNFYRRNSAPKGIA